MQLSRAKVTARSLSGSSAVVLAAMLLGGCDAPPESQRSAAAGEFTCAPRSGGGAGLAGEWQPFVADIDECSLRDGNGSLVLNVIAVSASRFYARQPDGAATVAMPKPLIVSATGQPLGRLPYNYPDDPPFASKLKFDEWRDGLPRRIHILVKDPTVSGDHELTMNWDDSRREYVGGKEK